ARARALHDIGSHALAITDLRLRAAAPRDEELDGASATVARAHASVLALEVQRSRLVLRSPMDGVILEPHPQQMSGRMLAAGDPLCTIVAADLAVAVLTPQDHARVHAGQRVTLMPPDGQPRATVIDAALPRAEGERARLRSVGLSGPGLPLGLRGRAIVHGAAVPLLREYLWQPLQRVAVELWIAG
ncbi:MAG: HlyD family secretion protein, partial [Nannocystaceae bacterium]|nr:HlyD family secretion protein [Nannocystaceae bacterium]